MNDFPKITFGIIVLNGEPFTRYCLRSIYPFAHEIIVVEGGSEACRLVATPDGHSIDGTLETLLRFKQEEDPENKVQIIFRQGFWPGKDAFGGSRTQQSQAYAEKATGDYLWQIDIDEFYQPADMLAVIEMLSKDPTITAVSFMTHTFWGRPEYSVYCWNSVRGSGEYHRLFKWGSKYHYVMHEPPTIVNGQGKDMHSLNWVRGKHLAQKGIYMYHYSLLLPWQVRQKTLIYQNERPDYCGEIVNWAENNYFQLKNPYRVHNLYKTPSWLERYLGPHPPQIPQMMREIDLGIMKCEIRQTDDIEKILSSWWYPIGIWVLKVGNIIDTGLNNFRVCLGKIKRFLINVKR